MTKIDSNNDKAAATTASLRKSLVYFAVAEEAASNNPGLHDEILKISADLFELLKRIEKGEFR